MFLASPPLTSLTQLTPPPLLPALALCVQALLPSLSQQDMVGEHTELRYRTIRDHLETLFLYQPGSAGKSIKVGGGAAACLPACLPAWMHGCMAHSAG